MFAIIETGGKQYLVKSGQTVNIEKVEAEQGKEFIFDKVLMLAEDDGSNVKLGSPYLDGVKVPGTVEAQERSAKIRVVKFKRKVRYHKVHGHRQHISKVKIGSIG